MPESIDNIIEKIREIKPYIEKDFFISEIGVFGSYVRNEQTDNSDIDILVDFKQGMDLFKLIDFKDYMEDLFGKKVDIVDKQTIKPMLAKYILSEVVYV